MINTENQKKSKKNPSWTDFKVSMDELINKTKVAIDNESMSDEDISRDIRNSRLNIAKLKDK